VKENKALATSEALQVSPKERQKYLEQMSAVLQACLASSQAVHALTRARAASLETLNPKP